MVIGNDSPVLELLNFLDSQMNGHTEHRFALHLVDPVCVSDGISFNFALTRRSRIFLGLRKETTGGNGNISFRVLSA